MWFQYTTFLSREEIKWALKKMGQDKTTGPKQIPTEVWYCLGEEGEAVVDTII